MAKRKQPGGGPKKYTLEFKLATVQTLRENGGNYYRTKKLTGITETTLKRWEERYGGEIATKDNVGEAVDNLIELKRDFQKKISPLFYEAIEAGVRRAIELIPMTRSIDDLRKMIQTFSDVAGITPEGAEGNEDNATYNLYQIVNQHLQKQQDDEENTITIQGDPEELPDK